MNVLSIQSSVAYGHVGNSAATFALQRLGVTAWPVHTVLFSNHTGYADWRGRVIPADEVADVIAGIEDRGPFPECDAVRSGDGGDAAVVEGLDAREQGLADAAGAVDQRLIKTVAVRLVWFLISQVPLAEDTGRVAGGLEHLWKRGCLERHPFAFEDGMSDAIFHRMPTGHYCAARRRASGAHQKPREPRAGVVKLVEVWRANPRMPVPPNRPVTLIIGDDENDVWFLGLGLVETTEDTD